MNATSAPNEIVVQTYGINIESIVRFFYGKAVGGDISGVANTLEYWWNIYSIIAILVSLVFFVGFIYAKIRYGQLAEIEHHAFHQAEHYWATHHAHAETKNSRWDIIQRRVAENSPESWRVGIIEADILLDETLTGAGYVGTSIGEKLKSANPQSFTTLQDAWEAHKVRNEIAHAGSDFILTKKSAQETMVRFERVFREFGVI